MSRIISVADDVYEELTARKGKDSYSTVIRKAFAEKKTNRDALQAFMGKGGVDERRVKELGKEWKKWSERYA
ncbi:MAG: antitoxin [Candidatus Diapherotrites archaeon]|uniref:Antitoxin n=1 Tax=Candidatus Iainarchaeum sp. TaxID=3101447 RepID=A0A8T3YK99_9ARCH|nr:antitoxin [Candidatus Diapherotrites archaeon]